MCAIEWHRYQWPWVTLKVTLAVWNHSNSNLSGGGIYHVITTICIHISQLFVKTERLLKVAGTLVHCERVVSQKWYKIDMLLLQTTNRKCHVAYWIVPLRWPSMTLQVIQLLQGLQIAFVEHLGNISHGLNWHSASRGPSATAEPLVNIADLCN